MNMGIIGKWVTISYIRRIYIESISGQGNSQGYII